MQWDLDTGNPTLVGPAIVRYGSEYVGNGWYFCWSTVESGTATVIKPYIYSAGLAGGLNFTGDGVSVATYFWGIQLEYSDGPTSYVKTSGALATRNADVLSFTANDGNVGLTKGTWTVKAINRMTDYQHQGGLLTITDGTSDYMRLWKYTSGGESRPLVWISSTASGLTTDIRASSIKMADRALHSYRLTYDSSLVEFYVDNSLIGQDTTVTLPDPSVLTRIYIDSLSASASSQGQMILRDVNIYNKPNKRAK
jgi:hypothetical protein